MTLSKTQWTWKLLKRYVIGWNKNYPMKFVTLLFLDPFLEFIFCDYLCHLAFHSAVKNKCIRHVITLHKMFTFFTATVWLTTVRLLSSLRISFDHITICKIRVFFTGAEHTFTKTANKMMTKFQGLLEEVGDFYLFLERTLLWHFSWVFIYSFRCRMLKSLRSSKPI